MSITKVLSDKDTDATNKLEAVSDIVANARQNYGNSEAEIQDPMVNTAHGSMRFSMLEAESKVELLRAEAARIKAVACEFVEQNPSANVNKKIEELISLNPLFGNIAAGTKFEYL